MMRRQDYRMGKVPAVLLLCALFGCADIREARRAQDPDKRRPGERTVSAEEAGLLPGSLLTVDQSVSIADVLNVDVPTRNSTCERTQRHTASTCAWPGVM